MSKILRNTMSTAIFALTALWSLSLAAYTWTDSNTGITWKYTLNDGKATIGTGNWSDPAIPTSTTGDLEIPSSINGYKVTSIGNYAFSGCSGLKSVAIPEGVTSIDYMAFYGCRGLTSVTIPSSVTSIWSYAFYGCSGLKSVTIPSGVASIGDFAFQDCSGLTSVTISEGVTSIDRCAFENCSGLTSVTIPSSVTNIGGSAFCNCSGLTSVAIPEGVASIGSYAFSGCSGLKSVTISEGVASIGSYAFSGCSWLTSVTIPSSVTRIGERAFSNCSGLTTVYVERGDIERVKTLYGWNDGTAFVETEHKVAFDANGGVCGVDEVLVSRGEAVGELPTATRTGYDFLGWFTEDGVAVTEATKVVADVTWYAHWSVIEYPITYVDTKGAANPNPTTYTIENEVNFEPLAGVEGFDFVGWSVAKIDKGSTGAIEVTATWKEQEPTYRVGTKGSLATGLIGYTAKGLPKGLKYDKKTGIISGVPTVATSGKVTVAFTKNGAATETIELEVGALPLGAAGTFNGFVASEKDETVNVGSVQATISDVGKITAKVITATGTYSFSGSGWDSASGDTYSVTLATKKGDVLKLSVNSSAAWNVHQLTGTFTVSGSQARSVKAQKNAFGKQWYFNAEGDAENGWQLSYAESSKTAALTISFAADGKTTASGKLGTNKISASGYADVSGLTNGVIYADFAPVISVKIDKKTTKKVLSLRTNLWFDRKNKHEEGVGFAVFAQ